MFHQTHYLFLNFILGYSLEGIFRTVKLLETEFSLFKYYNKPIQLVISSLSVSIVTFELQPIKSLWMSSTHLTYLFHIFIDKSIYSLMKVCWFDFWDISVLLSIIWLSSISLYISPYIVPCQISCILNK